MTPYLLLTSLVKPGGHVIFTTHGLESVSNLGNVQYLTRRGFEFQPSSEQKDLKTAEYGFLACTRPEFVFSQLFSEPKNQGYLLSGRVLVEAPGMFTSCAARAASCRRQYESTRPSIAKCAGKNRYKRILPNRQ